MTEAKNTGNLVELRPLSERKKDAEVMMKDDGKGGTADANNREYKTITEKNGDRREYEGPVVDPASGAAGVKVTGEEDANTVTGSHSHPSGTNSNLKGTFGFDQPASGADIRKVPDGQTRSVFGRRSDLVYIYNNTGIIAVLPTQKYIKQ